MEVSFESKVFVFLVLKGDFLKVDINSFFFVFCIDGLKLWEFIIDFYFGGYVRYCLELIQFFNYFY